MDICILSAEFDAELGVYSAKIYHSGVHTNSEKRIRLDQISKTLSPLAYLV
jgi:hypothetical protein